MTDRWGFSQTAFASPRCQVSLRQGHAHPPLGQPAATGPGVKLLLSKEIMSKLAFVGNVPRDHDFAVTHKLGLGSSHCDAGAFISRVSLECLHY